MNSKALTSKQAALIASLQQIVARDGSHWADSWAAKAIERAEKLGLLGQMRVSDRFWPEGASMPPSYKLVAA
jgi:hypothetical protein